MRTCIHFGAGALGRGLVVPRLVEAGWKVTVVDPVHELLSQLRADQGYWLETRDNEGELKTHIPLAAALHPQEDAATITRELSIASLVTTAVRKENLPETIRQIAATWAEAMPADVSLVACENIERVDVLVGDLLNRTPLPLERQDQIRVPRTVVDRICANGWPETTAIRTETYSELAISRFGRPLAGIDVAQNIDAIFDRKRYLVNTFADAAAILGLARGYRFLSQAFQDWTILDELAPLLAALKLHLELRHGLPLPLLDAYAETSRARLADDYIPRRLETVARDIWRKMAPGERFVAPLIDLERRGQLADAPLAITARLVALGNDLGGDKRDIGIALLDIIRTHADDPHTVAVYNQILGHMRHFEQ